MKNGLTLLHLFFVLFVYSQKTEEKIIDNTTIKSIYIEGNTIFKIDVISSSSKNIKIATKIDGEYAQKTKFLTKVNNNTLFITADYPELTNKTDDKLNAHKVHSIEISLEIPKHLSLYIKSDIASAKISGTYKYLLLELNQGNAKIFNFRGNATINTFNGNIFLETDDATIEAKTKNGTLKTEEILESQNQIKIKTINGNINIYKAKNN